jgi:hypothetical protein
MFTKSDALSLAAVPGTEVATCSLKLMLHPWLLSRERLLYVHLN